MIERKTIDINLRLNKRLSQRSIIKRKDAICNVKLAWDLVDVTTIQNCWHHIQILPQNLHDDYESNPTQENFENVDVLTQVLKIMMMILFRPLLKQK